MTAVVVGIDVGTGSTKAVALRLDGRVLARAQTPHRTRYGAGGEAEQDAKGWLRGCQRSMADLFGTGVFRPQDVEAIALSGQIRSLVVVDESGSPVRPAVVWFDPRSDDRGESVRRSLPDVETATAPITAQTAAAKLLWLRTHEPRSYRAVAAVRSPKDFVVQHLGGESVSDPSDASGSGLLDLVVRDWSWPLIDALELDRRWFPRLEESGSPIGSLTRAGEKLLGLPEGTPIVAGGADNACAALGCGVVDGAVGVCSIGTCGLALVGLSEPWPRPPDGIELLCHAAPDCWYALGFLLTGGRAIEWTARLLSSGVGKRALERTLSHALALPASAGRPLFLPFLEGESAAVASPLPGGAFVGLRTAHSRLDLLRSVLEGLAFAVRDLLDRIAAAGRPVEGLRAAGGLAALDGWPELLASVAGVPVARPQAVETTEVGAAMLAAAGIGMFSSVRAAAAAMVRLEAEFEPDTATADIYADRYRRYRDAGHRLRPDPEGRAGPR